MATAVIASASGLGDRMMSGSPPHTPSSNVSTTSVDWETKYHEVSDLLQETRAELDEFQTSSKELEEELERELESTEQQMTDLRNKVERVEREREDCKSKLATLQGTHNTTVNSLQRELDALRQQHALIKVQLRELEVGNDDLERSEREVSSSLADLEGRYARALEEKILLEHELQDRVALEEDMQRLRDELRDANEESTMLKEQNTRLTEQHCSLDTQNKSLSEELSRTRDELAQTRHLVELARNQSHEFPSAPSTARTSTSSRSRSPTPSAASRTSDDLQLEDLQPKSAPPSAPKSESGLDHERERENELVSANVTPRAKSAIPVTPSNRTMSVTRRPVHGSGIAVPSVVRTPNATTLFARSGFGGPNALSDSLRRSTTLPVLSSPIPTRLPTVRNSPVPPPTTPRPRMVSTLSTATTSKRGTAVQMVGEMRARVRTLEQKINRVPLPKIRNSSLRTKVLGPSKENANGWNPESGAESPGWVIVADGHGTGKEMPSPSPLPRQPLVERGERTAERTRTSFSSDRSSRKSLSEEHPPPSAFRGVPTPSPSSQEFPSSASGRTTPASTVGSTRIVSRSGNGNGRSTPSTLFGIGMTIRRPLSRNASHGGGVMVPSLPSIPSLSRIPSSPLPGSADLSSDDYHHIPGRPTTPSSSSMTMLPIPVDRSPSKSDIGGIRRSTRRLSLHPSGHHGAPATSPALPAGLTGAGSSSASASGVRKPVSPPGARTPGSGKSMSPSTTSTPTGAGKMSPPGKKSPGAGIGASQSMLGMSRIGRPNSFGLTSSRIGAPSTTATAKDKAAAAGRTRSGSVGWGRDR